MRVSIDLQTSRLPATRNLFSAESLLSEKWQLRAVTGPPPSHLWEQRTHNAQMSTRQPVRGLQCCFRKQEAPEVRSLKSSANDNRRSPWDSEESRRSRLPCANSADNPGDTKFGEQLLLSRAKSLFRISSSMLRHTICDWTDASESTPVSHVQFKLSMRGTRRTEFSLDAEAPLTDLLGFQSAT